MAVVLCMVAGLLALRQRMAWRGLQRLVPPMVNTQRRSGQRPSVLHSRAGRCGQNWLSWRLGSWTTGTSTRTGGIGSSDYVGQYTSVNDLVMVSRGHFLQAIDCGLTEVRAIRLQKLNFARLPPNTPPPYARFGGGASNGFKVFISNKLIVFYEWKNCTRDIC
jgi:hypothetical protein